MPELDLVSRVTRELEEAIMKGRLTAGERFPSERQLCRQLGVSRGVVREAIGRLEGLGLIQSRARFRSRVAPPNGKDLVVGLQRLIDNGRINLIHLNSVRLPLETAIAREAAVNRLPEHLRRLEEPQVVLRKSSQDLEACSRADLDFHLVLAEASGNPLYSILLEPVHNFLMENHRRTLALDPGALIVYREHGCILEAVRAGQPAVAAAAMRKHIQGVIRIVKRLIAEELRGQNSSEPEA